MQRFPYLSHRTMAEVAETERLLRMDSLGFTKTSARARRLDMLLNRADINNPLPEPPQDAA
jgi:hypothetical protein